jgi:DNA-binding MarR family transcriptional regulator
VAFRTRALERATHDVGGHLQEALHELRVTQADIHVLGYLAEAGPSNVAEIHASFGHRRSTLSSVLNRLESRGWILRSIDPEDRRSIVVTTTAAGAIAASRVREAVEDLERRVADTATPIEQEGFSAVLAAVGRETRTG